MKHKFEVEITNKNNEVKMIEVFGTSCQKVLDEVKKMSTDAIQINVLDTMNYKQIIWNVW